MLFDLTNFRLLVGAGYNVMEVLSNTLDMPPHRSKFLSLCPTQLTSTSALASTILPSTTLTAGPVPCGGGTGDLKH